MEKNKINIKDESIFDGAIKVFAKKGFDGATLDEIIKEANVGKGTIYRRIGNKEKIESFIMGKMGSLMFGRIKEGISKSKDPILQFKGIINIMCDFFDEKPQIAMLFYSRMFFNPKKPNIMAGWPPITGLKTDALVENIIKDAIKKKLIINIDADIFLRGFTYFCNPFYYHFLKETANLTKSEISVLITDMLLYGVAPMNRKVN